METRSVRRTGKLGMVLLLLGLIALSLDAMAAPGQLDRSFSRNGKTTTDFNDYSDFAEAVDILGSGKVLVSGTSYNGSTDDFAVARYKENGKLDDSFSNDGRRVFDVYGDYETSELVFQRNDGKIVLGGSYSQGVTVVRFKPGGGIDNTFGGGDGKGEIITGQSLFISGGTNPPGGKIVLVGSRFNGVDNNDFFVARFTPDGLFDPSFGGGDGWVSVDFPGTDFGEARDAVGLPNGKLLVTGMAGSNGGDSDFATVRLETDGDVDPGFGNGGYRRIDFHNRNDSGRTIGLQDGRIVLGGDADDPNGNDHWGLTRLNSNGNLDQGFGRNGRVMTDVLTDDDDELRALGVQSNGKIVAGGRYDSDGQMVVARYQANGALDRSFGRRGKVFVEFPMGSEVDNLALRGGKVVVVGDVDKSPPPGSLSEDFNDFGVARLQLN